MQQAGKQTYMVLKNYINLIESVCDASSFSVGDRCMHARMAFGLHTSHNVLYCRHIFTEKAAWRQHLQLCWPQRGELLHAADRLEIKHDQINKVQVTVLALATSI